MNDDLTHMPLDALMVRAEVQRDRSTVPGEGRAALAEVQRIHAEIRHRRDTGRVRAHVPEA